MKTKNCLFLFLVLVFSSNIFCNAAEVDLERLKELEDKISKAEKKSSLKRNLAIVAGALTGVAVLACGGYFCYSKNEEFKRVCNENNSKDVELNQALYDFRQANDEISKLVAHISDLTNERDSLKALADTTQPQADGISVVEERKDGESLAQEVQE